MTISQARLHAMAEAARSILGAYGEKVQSLRSVLTMARRGDLTGEELIALLDSIASPLPLADERALLAAESAHYAATSGKNERERAYRARARGAEADQARGQDKAQTQALTALGLSEPLPTVSLTDAERREIAQESELMGLTQTARAMERGGLDPTAGLLPGYEWDEASKTVRRTSSASTNVQPPDATEDDWGT